MSKFNLCEGALLIFIFFEISATDNPTYCKSAFGGNMDWFDQKYRDTPPPEHSKFALIWIVYDDVESPPLDEVTKYYMKKPNVDAINDWSDGCASYDITTFGPVSPDANSDSCDVTQFNIDEGVIQLEKSHLLDFYETSDQYDMVIFGVVSNSCTTSLSYGSSGGSIYFSDGTRLEGFANMGMLGWRLDSMAPEQINWDEPQQVFLHELGHYFGFGFHSNSATCLEPSPDILNCPSDEYGDWFDVLGSGGSYSYGLHAKLRYTLGWLGGNEIHVVKDSERVTIFPLGVRDKGPRAAVIIPKDTNMAPKWVEFRNGDGYGDEKIPNCNFNGVFVMEWNILIDGLIEHADEWKDGFKWSTEEWHEKEGKCMALTKDGAFYDLTSGLGIKGVKVNEDGTISFDVIYDKSYLPVCKAQIPVIGTGLFGMWMWSDPSFCTNCDLEMEDQEMRELLPDYAHTLAFSAEHVRNMDPVSCKDSEIELKVKLLPDGFGYAIPPLHLYYAEMAPGSYSDSIFGIGFPDGAEEREYDVCVVAVSKTSGLRTSQPFRFRVPAPAEWWNYNRPAYYDPPAIDCSQFVGCDPDYPDCKQPEPLELYTSVLERFKGGSSLQEQCDAGNDDQCVADETPFTSNPTKLPTHRPTVMPTSTDGPTRRPTAADTAKPAWAGHIPTASHFLHSTGKFPSASTLNARDTSKMPTITGHKAPTSVLLRFFKRSDGLRLCGYNYLLSISLAIMQIFLLQIFV